MVPDPHELRERCYCEHKSAHGSHSGAVRFLSGKGRDHRPDRRIPLRAKLKNCLTGNAPHCHQSGRFPRRTFIEERRSCLDDLGDKVRDKRLIQHTDLDHRTAMFLPDVARSKTTMRANMPSLKQANFCFGQVCACQKQLRDHAERRGPASWIQDWREGHSSGTDQPRGLRL